MAVFVQVLVAVPSRVLLEQFTEELPGFCKVGTGYNDKIDFSCRGFISVTDSVQLLKRLKFEACFVDEGHHPLPQGMPSYKDLFKFSATHKEDVDFRYSLGQAIEQGVLSDYDLTVPVTTQGHPYTCLANLLLSQAGRFRRVLAYCNSIAEAKRFRKVLETVGLAASHINGETSSTERESVMNEFSGELQKPVHVLVTVQVLGEGVNIPNADTCMFVEPRSSYVSIIQAMGRVLRPHPAKPLAHIVLPAIVMPATSEMAAVIPVGSSDATASAQSMVRKTGFGEYSQSLESEAMRLDQGSAYAPRVRAFSGAAGRHGSKSVASAQRTTKDRHGRQLTTKEAPSHADFDRVPKARRSVPVQNQLLASGDGRLENRTDRFVDSISAARSLKVKSRDNTNRATDDQQGAELRHPARPVPTQTMVPMGSVASLQVAQVTDAGADSGRLARMLPNLDGRDRERALPQLPGSLLQTETSWDAAKGSYGAGRLSAPAQSDLTDSGWATGSRLGGRRDSVKVQDTRQGDNEQGAELAGASSHSPGPMIAMTDGKQHNGRSTHDEEAAGQSTVAPSLMMHHRPRMESKASSRNVTHRRASKLKVKTLDDASLFGKGYADQLDRFMEAITRADSRFDDKEMRHLQSRLCLMDCRLQRPIVQQLLARGVLDQLASILQQSDAWDLRLQAVEKFDQEHGKLPRQLSNQLEERTLGLWLHNVAYRQKRLMLSAERMQKLLNSSSTRLRARVAKWLDADASFTPWLETLRQFVQVHHRMPSTSKERSRAEQQLIKNLLQLVNPTNLDYRRRLQRLEEVDPIVADWVKTRRARKLRVNRAQWNRQFDSLLGFLAVNERLPRQRLEGILYSWLCRQRRQLHYLPAQLQSKLRESHPIIAAFLQS